MNDDHDFERRLSGWLHAEAPVAPPDLGVRLLRQTAATPQRRGWLRSSSLVPALAAAAVLAVAVFVGLQLGQVRDGQTPPVGTQPAATPTGSPSATPSATPSVTPSPSPGVFTDGQRCTNDTHAYTVEYPADWYANEEIPASEGLDGIAACLYFASAPFVVQPNAQLPPSVAIGFQRVADEPPLGGTLIRSDTVTVDGREATVREFEADSGGFLPPGTLFYEYLVPLDDGDVHEVSTDTTRDGDYEEHRTVLDLMMRTLSLGS